MSHITRRRITAPKLPQTTVQQTEVHEHVHNHVGALWIAGALAATNLAMLAHFVLHLF
jgi:hypothetical protein